MDLMKEEKQILGDAGWDRGSFNDFMIGGNAKPADFWHDPLNYLLLGIGTGSLFKAGAGLVSTATTISKAEVAEGGITVLGRYPRYTTVAKDVGGKIFNVSSDVWDKIKS